MATVELARFIADLEELSPTDWTRPTACALWNVREMVAHVAGAVASYARWPDFARQWSPLVQLGYRQAGFATLDAVNQIQVDDRECRQPNELIDELRTLGPSAISTRHRLPAMLRAARVPMPVLGVVPIGYLTDLIYTRDMWVHRLDLARATGRPMELSAEHDGRVLALMVRDLARALGPTRGRATVRLDLGGAAGGTYRIGESQAPEVTLRLDGLDFAWLAAGRLSADEGRDLVTMRGDRALAERFLAAISVPV